MTKAALPPDDVLALHLLPHAGVGGDDGEGGEEESGQVELGPEGDGGLQGRGEQVADCHKEDGPHHNDEDRSGQH